MTVTLKVKGEDSTLSYKEWEVLDSNHPVFVAQHRSIQFARWGEGDAIVYDNQIFVLRNLQFTPPKHGYQVATFNLETSA